MSAGTARVGAVGGADPVVSGSPTDMGAVITAITARTGAPA